MKIRWRPENLTIFLRKSALSWRSKVGHNTKTTPEFESSYSPSTMILYRILLVRNSFSSSTYLQQVVRHIDENTSSSQADLRRNRL
ncbi:hypothetical protein PoB_005059900 [Plakobranchus ocellatus]|uniref:Uncharacterized protein n=1 Tax=Plakobranchus ocellatus TaxID=259542 RepID=A0AAV4BV67_9GAST|nr:hypothetical protein PoB_005059900 [Plakobranchus ocellatus]